MALIFWLLFGGVNYLLASNKNRSKVLWTFLGFFFGIFATIILLLLDSKEDKTVNDYKDVDYEINN